MMFTPKTGPVSPDVLCISFLITRQVLVPRSHNTGNPEWRLSRTERDPVCPVPHLHFENKLCPSCPVDAAVDPIVVEHGL